MPFQRVGSDVGDGDPGADRVPALGAIVGALEVCEDVAQRFPAAGLWPSHPDDLAAARVLAAQTWPALERELPFRFLELKPAPALSTAAQAELKALQQAWAQSREKYEKVGPWLVGKFSVADCMAAPFACRALTYGLSLDKAYVETVLALPALKRWAEAAALDRADALKRP